MRSMASLSPSSPMGISSTQPLRPLSAASCNISSISRRLPRWLAPMRTPLEIRFWALMT
ncbi:unnamed protein product [Penicillium roqueforti FM164]|uniref:Genomic scaffold, ProqFM164S03 n=1 Tax=Penicillium roqueforti (strain FM164) TaxID=1365484 RepID=W6QBW9_PENRF|nr:unnamed protein product [Penicillium roqueforti FM164]